MKPAKLVLANGETFNGMLQDVQKAAVSGEVVFNTGMVGYVEAMSDPSYAGQLLTFTYPLIGNYGVPEQSAWESTRIQVSGIIVSEASEFFAHHEATQSFLAWCASQDVPVLSGVDTRALAKVISREGVMPGIIKADDHADIPFFDIGREHLVKKVSITEPQIVGEGEKCVVAIDCGMKENIMRHLLKFPIKVKRVPFDYDFTDEVYDAVFISNGPGDPTVCTETLAIVKKVLAGNKPVFGICLGAQLMALAIGAKTYKLPFGHRAQNHPCIEEGTDRCFLTSQNHGYSIDEKSLPSGWEVQFRNLNDNSVQGIRHCEKPFFSVQFHPEEAPGPVDTQFLFKQFYESINEDEKTTG